MSKAFGTILGRPAGVAGATGATSLGLGIRARPVVGRRTQIDRADGGASARGKRAGDAAVDRTKSLALGSGLARFGATQDRGVDARSDVGHRRHGLVTTWGIARLHRLRSIRRSRSPLCGKWLWATGRRYEHPDLSQHLGRTPRSVRAI